MRSPRSHWDLETDFLVIGAGAAGMTAALVAALEGLQTILCEKSSAVGGTTATAAGTIWVPGSHQSEAAGVPDSVERARTYLTALLGREADDERLDAYLKTGPLVLGYLERKTGIRFVPPAVHPDYKNLPGAAVGGRALGTLPFDGRRLGRDFERVRPPRREFMLLGGMMIGKQDIPPLLDPFGSWSNFVHASGLLARHAKDRFRWRRGTRLVMGNALVASLFYELRKTTVDIRFDTALRELIRAGDEVVGAVLASPGGELAVRARKGVVLATGGIGWSSGLRDRLLPACARAYSLAPSSVTGDGILAAEQIGVTIESGLQSPVLWMPSSMMEGAGGSTVFPHIMLDRAKPGLLAVDKNGRRFVNEADSYHDFVAAMVRRRGPESRVPSFLICDRRFIWDYGLGLIHPRTRNLERYLLVGYLLMGDTVEELAGKIGVDGSVLSQTVERYNQYARSGVDEEFGRGASELNRFNGDPSNEPNPCLRSLGPGPYCAVAVWPSDLASSAGLPTDSRARVIASEGRLLNGLYAAGNDAASIFRGTYPGPGTMIGPAIVFGWRAAMDAAGALETYLESARMQGKPRDPASPT